MKTLLLFVTVFKLASPSTLVAASTRLTAVFPSLAVPLAIAVTSFNYKNHNVKGCQKKIGLKFCSKSIAPNFLSDSSFAI